MKEYLQRYSDDEIERIIQNPEKRISFVQILKETSWPTEHSGEITQCRDQTIWYMLPNIENYKNLLHHVRIWEPTRQELLDTLVQCRKDLNTISKWSTYGRIIGCAVESACTIGGLYGSQSQYANHALFAATCFGGMGFTMTLGGLKMSMDSFYNLMKAVQRDQKLFAPIQSWYQQSEELEKAMKNEFPFDFTKTLVKAINGIITRDEHFDSVNLLSRILLNIFENHKEKIKDPKFIQSLINSISCPPFKDFCEW